MILCPPIGDYVPEHWFKTPGLANKRSPERYDLVHREMHRVRDSHLRSLTTVQVRHLNRVVDAHPISIQPSLYSPHNSVVPAGHISHSRPWAKHPSGFSGPVLLVDHVIGINAEARLWGVFEAL